MTGDDRATTAEPAGRLPAPGGLRLVQEFLNSADLEDGIDQFETVDGLRDWLVARDLAEPGLVIRPADLVRVVALREALRSVLAARDDGPASPAVLATANGLAGSVPLRVRMDAAGEAVLDPDGRGLDAALARILAELARASIDGSWRRLKVCRRDICRWAFYDASKNRSGSWCAMAICGNRTKSTSYRRRRGAHGPQGTAGTGQRRKVLPQVPSQTT